MIKTFIPKCDENLLAGWKFYEYTPEFPSNAEEVGVSSRVFWLIYRNIGLIHKGHKLAGKAFFYRRDDDVMMKLMLGIDGGGRSYQY